MSRWCARGDAGSDAGSIALELTLVAPLLLLMVALVVGYGRVAQVNGVMEAGTRDAARAASQARSVASAETSARDAVLSSIGGPDSECGRSLQVDVVGLFAAGVPVKVRARCSYPLGDLGLPGLPGSVTVSSSFTSPVDPDRGVESGYGQ